MLIATLAPYAQQAQEIVDHQCIDQICLDANSELNRSADEILSRALAIIRCKPVHLEVGGQGFLCDRDKEFIQAGKLRGIRRYILALFNENAALTELITLVPKAEVVIKVRSLECLNQARHLYNQYPDRIRSVAVWGGLLDFKEFDLYVIFEAQNLFATQDHDCEVGYRALLLSETLCRCRESWRNAVNIYSQHRDINFNSLVCHR